jgi:hypothetical protein
LHWLSPRDAPSTTTHGFCVCVYGMTKGRTSTRL